MNRKPAFIALCTVAAFGGAFAGRISADAIPAGSIPAIVETAPTPGLYSFIRRDDATGGEFVRDYDLTIGDCAGLLTGHPNRNGSTFYCERQPAPAR